MQIEDQEEKPNSKPDFNQSIKMFDFKRRLSKKERVETLIGQNLSSSFRKNGNKTQMMMNFPIKTLNYYI